MALDQIWKQQLALVTYGNEYLAQDLSFNHWLKHQVFNQHQIQFRDLLSQHLLAQHFQIWLEHLKQQGVRRLSLHQASILNDEKNPNPNVELLPFAHFIVSHEAQHKSAWIFGKELAEWYTAEQDYMAPVSQQSELRQEVMWRYQLNHKLTRQLDTDFASPNWDEIDRFIRSELFLNPCATEFVEPEQSAKPYFGVELTQNATESMYPTLALIPADYPADYAHQMLYRLDALDQHIQNKIQHPYHADGTELEPSEQLNLRHFSQKLEDLHTKFITKVANHYQTAQLTPVQTPDPFESTPSQVQNIASPQIPTPAATHKVGTSAVIKLILMTVVICAAAYYFGL